MKLLTLAAGIALAMASVPMTTSFVLAAANISEVATIDHSMRASKLIGMAVYNDQGTSVGKVVEILVTSGAAEPSVILSVGDFVGGGNKMVSVPLSHVHLAADKLAMPTATKEHLTAMPSWTFTGLNGGGG